MDRELRDWLRSLAVDADSPPHPAPQLSDEAASHLERIAEDGTLLRAVLSEIAAAEPELAG